jgi:type II secretory ATPase GspE/PulE/Tfp pilus assembly ATPase PilB-like protein
MRILDKSGLVLGLPELGFFSDDQAAFEQLIGLPDGILLVTGPTGSGKTTTLYACLNVINKPDRKIITVEDPVEYEMPGINQVMVKTDIGMTFAAALRAMLRQAPNIIMIGEIRDAETANIAINASLTGHLVLSTLHTNDAPSAVTRLIDMGIQPYQISSSVLAVLAQRLVRRLCPACRIAYYPKDEQLLEIGLDATRLEEHVSDLRKAAATTIVGEGKVAVSSAADLGPIEGTPRADGVIFFRPAGCDACSHTGYRGRLGIFEMMQVDEPVRREILKGSDAKIIQRVARGQQGMRLLREDGARQVFAGVTSIEEVLAATQAGET